MAVSQKNLYSVRSGQVSTETLSSIETHLNRAIEVVWLVAAFLVPLIVLSEQDFSSFTELPKITLMRSLAGVGLILWLMAVATGLAKSSLDVANVPVPRVISLRRWAVAHPIEAAAALVLLATGISAALSIQPLVSALGAEWGRDGFDLHTTASYITIFFLAATRIRSRDQLIRLWGTISLAGLLAALTGIAQHFAMSPFGISGTYQHQRVTGTVGNPLFLGSLLNLTLVIGVAFAVAGATGALRRAVPSSAGNGKRRVGQSTEIWLGDRRIWWGVLAVIVFIHIYAAALTASRGPWIGMATGLAVLVVLAFKAQGLKTGTLVGVSVASGVVLAIFVAVGPLSSGVESFAAVEQQQLFEERTAAGEATDAIAPAAVSRVLERRGYQGTVQTRLTIWEAAGEVITERPSLPESNNAPWVVRQVFGYGPDTFRFVFPTKAPGELMTILTSTAHNDPLNRLVEIGLAGLLSYVLLLLAAIFVIWRLLTRASGEHSALVGLIAVGAGAAIVGRLAEQMSGVAEVSDTTVIWLLLALLAAAYAITVRANRSPEAESPGGMQTGWSLPTVPPALAFSLIAVGIALTGYFVWAHNINLLRSDMEFKKGEIALSTDVDLALGHMERAISLNPGVEEYRHAQAEVLQARAELGVGISKRSELLQEAYDIESKAYAFNPTSRAANFELAFASWQLAQLGDGNKALETLATYERLSELAPEHPLVLERLEQLRLAVGTIETR